MDIGRLRDSIVGTGWSLLDRVLRGRALPFGSPKSILIIKTCCLGDVLFASATVKVLDEAFPAARLGMVVGRHSLPAVSHRIDEVIDCGDLGSGKQFNFREYLALVRTIRAGKWDAAVVLERSALFAVLPRLAGIPVRAGIDSGGRGVGLTHRSAWIEGSHESDVYLGVVKAAGLSVDGALPEYVPSPEDATWASNLVATIDRPFAVLHPAGGVNPGMVLAAKRWPTDRYASLARALIDRGFAVAVVGSPGDVPVAEPVIRAAGNAGINLVGMTTFGQLGALATRSAVWVGNDSGPTHLAAAAGAPTVGIFGPSTPAMYAPRGTAAVSLWEPPECSPCFIRGRFDESCTHWKCIHAVSVEQVLNAVDGLARGTVEV